jgi:acetyl-CoA synthetase
MENSIKVLSDERREFHPKSDYSQTCFIKTEAQYEEIYEKSTLDIEGFWADMAASNLHWYKRWDNVLEYDFNLPMIKWFSGGKLNVSYNCLDRHLLNGRRNKAAIIWESNSGAISSTHTYQQLYHKVNRFANVLKKHGIKKGDRVMIYLPMIPELVISMLACDRIRAVHSVVFAGFSAKALTERIRDCGARIVITADFSFRGDKLIPLKSYVDEAVEVCDTVERVIVVKFHESAAQNVEMKTDRYLWWHDQIAAGDIKNYCEPEWMDAEDPLFILYTSGSTGKPKGVLHTSAGYLLYAELTFKWIFNCREDDIHFCTADIGWITGHSYIEPVPKTEFSPHD